MKWSKRLLIILLLAVAAALGFLFWPKIREAWDRWIAGAQRNEPERPK